MESRFVLVRYNSTHLIVQFEIGKHVRFDRFQFYHSINQTILDVGFFHPTDQNHHEQKIRSLALAFLHLSTAPPIQASNLNSSIASKRVVVCAVSTEYFPVSSLLYLLDSILYITND
jgi:hypothetical protein